MSTPAGVNRRRIFLVRHGAVQYVAADKNISARTDVQLTPRGCDQAVALGKHLEGVVFDRVLSSPLTRCLETATRVSGVAVEQIATVPGLREISPGPLGNISPRDLAQTCTDVFSDARAGSTFLGGETFGALADRVRSSMDEVLKDPSWRTCLIVAHEVVNRAVLAQAMKVDVSVFDHLEQEECALNILDVTDEGHFLVRLMNYMAYNPLAAGHYSRSMERLAAALTQGGN